MESKHPYWLDVCLTEQIISYLGYRVAPTAELVSRRLGESSSARMWVIYSESFNSGGMN